MQGWKRVLERLPAPEGKSDKERIILQVFAVEPTLELQRDHIAYVNAKPTHQMYFRQGLATCLIANADGLDRPSLHPVLYELTPRSTVQPKG